MWQETNNKLINLYTFPDFSSALEFVNKVGHIAEEMNHHPEIKLSWGRAEISLSTHDSNSVTEKDWDLANRIDKIK